MASAVRSGPHRDADERNCPAFLLQSEKIPDHLGQLYAGVSKAPYSQLDFAKVFWKYCHT